MERETRIERNKRKKVEQKQSIQHKGLVTLRVIADVTRVAVFIKEAALWALENL